MKFTFYSISILFFTFGFSQSSSQYEISFENAMHHEANIKATFNNLKKDTVSLRMSRSSPGRYALHEFAKNVYDVKFTDGQGKELMATRPNPYEWSVTGHRGTIKISYTLFADRGDGTYSQIDETHAHLNIPATFMYAPYIAAQPFEVTFNIRKDLNWKVATQLIPKNETTFTAPNLQYFMDSPVEISDHSIREFKYLTDNKESTIRFVLHHLGTEKEFDTYFDKVKKIVEQEKAVFGEYPKFENNTYTFLACYMPQVSGDGMEHRNSTILTDTESLAEGGMENNIGTVAHEFFHSWNVERIRPKELEPFNFEEANMTGALWFAEGFTSYYTTLILCRAGVISQKKYVEGLSKAYNYVWNSPARRYFNPIEMSYQAPFVDAATSVDPVNRGNTFISYYSYGSMLGLALDISLRNQKKKLNLDAYMRLVWETYGKKETPYTINDLEEALQTYAGKSFADDFFKKYIYDSQMPDYKILLAKIGVDIHKDPNVSYTGFNFDFKKNKNTVLSAYSLKDSPAYQAGLDKGDVIISINDESFSDENEYTQILKKYKPGDKVVIAYQRHGKKLQTELQLVIDPTNHITVLPKLKKNIQELQNSWLEAK